MSDVFNCYAYLLICCARTQVRLHCQSVSLSVQLWESGVGSTKAQGTSIILLAHALLPKAYLINTAWFRRRPFIMFISHKQDTG